MGDVELSESSASGCAKVPDDFPTFHIQNSSFNIEHHGIERAAWLSRESSGGVGRRLKTSIGTGELRM
jgi:hypothetical protein